MCGLWAAGFSFSKCHAELRVPYDANLIQIWTGEEFGRGARLWTSGYDFYTPTQPLIAHDYSPGKDQKKWNHDQTEYAHSKARLQSILRQVGSDQSEAMRASIESRYDIGDKRTLLQYGEFCGVDIVNKKELFSWCQDYKWVPYRMDEAELNEIRRFGNPSYFRREGEAEEEGQGEAEGEEEGEKKVENASARGFISMNLRERAANEELIYREIVGEIEHFQHSSWFGKLMHIVVLVAFLTCFVWCAYHVFRASSPKSFGDKQQ